MLRTVPATVVLLVINALVFLAMLGGQDSGNWSARYLLDWGGNLGSLTLHGEPWRLLTAIFLHGSFGHISGNMLCLLAWGSVVEIVIGTARFVPAYFAFGIFAGVVGAWAHPDVVSVGASGAIAGILGVLVVMWLRGDGRVSAGGLLANIAINAFISFMPSVDGFAHVAGFAAGLALGPLLFPASLVVKAEEALAVPLGELGPARPPPMRVSFREPMDFPKATAIYQTRTVLIAILPDGKLVADNGADGMLFGSAADYREQAHDEGQWTFVKEIT